MFTAAQRSLVDSLRADSRIDCAPRTRDLPPGAAAGIECHIGSEVVDRVGVYALRGAARDAYLDRLRTAGVTPGSGDCAAGTAGDGAWPANLPDTGDDAGLRETRLGCFIDENGAANVRLTCYGDIYVGVLGTTADLARLTAWSWKVAKGGSVDRDAPGLCAAPD